MNTRWVFAGIAVSLIALYALTYVSLSLNGTYRPAALGLNGIKWWNWSPAGYVDRDYKPRKTVFIAFLPLWVLDKTFWHDRDLVPDENRDGHINVRGRIIDAESVKP